MGKNDLRRSRMQSARKTASVREAVGLDVAWTPSSSHRSPMAVDGAVKAMNGAPTGRPKNQVAIGRRPPSVGLDDDCYPETARSASRQ